MKKFLALALVVVMALAMTACGQKAAPAEVYTTQVDFLEAGYEGDCINQNAQTLVLNADGTYTLVNNFTVNQVSGIVVFYTTTFYQGTYKVTSTTEGVKTVELSAATSAIANSMGAATSSADDAELLEGCPAHTVKCDTANNALIAD